VVNQKVIRPEYRNRQVLTEWWMPSHPELEYPLEMVRWVDSINKGWQYKIDYENLELYKLQAEQWLLDKSVITDFENLLDQEEWLRYEIQKCKENSLYFCNKYGKIIDAKSKEGSLDYTAWEAQEALLFLFDSGYSFMIGKARQIGFTTTMCLAGMKKVALTPSYFIKFITHSKDKGIEIFRDKVKWTYNKIPDYLAKEVKNWTDQVMSFETKGSRKGREQAGQRFQVDPPSITAINGGSPACVMVDEIGLFEIFGLMMSEARPALFKVDPVTGKMVMQQQFVAWGTSGDMDKGGAVFETLFTEYLKAWKMGDYSNGIIPLFFNIYARKGITKEFIAKEKAIAESLKDTVDGEKLMVQFYQQYAVTIADMFLRSEKTLVDRAFIDKKLEQIYSKEDYIEYGHFVPILDKSQPTPDLFTEYKIIGAEWIKGNEGDVSVTAMIINHPPKNENWKNRWYQGTDPINSETGHSKMASAMWDSLTNSVSACVFSRERNFKETYLQCLLMGLYYDQMNEGGAKELLENNIGDMYLDFQEIHGFRKRHVPNSALPEYLQTNTKWFGISKRTNTSPRIIAKLEELIDAYADNIDIPWFWEQLKKFVEKDLKQTANSTGQRQTKYQAKDLRYDYDDVIDAITFAYINAISHAKKEPVNIREEQLLRKVTKRYLCNEHTGFQKLLCDVDNDGNFLRINPFMR
jgi:hypothetical protein